MHSEHRPHRGSGSLREYFRGRRRVEVRWIVRTARVAGKVLHSVRTSQPTPQEVAEVLSPFGIPADAKLIAREIALQDRMNNAVLAVNHAHGSESVLGLIDSASLARIEELMQSPAATIILGWRHVGPPVVLAAAIRNLNAHGRSALVGGLFERHPTSGAARQESLETPSRPLENPSEKMRSDVSRTAGLWQLVQHLKSGGIVGMQANDPKGTTLDVPCAGRTLQFGRGPFVLARLTGAPIVPIMKRWTSSHQVAFVVGPPLRPVEETGHADVEYDRRLAIAAARWIESRIRETPDALRPAAIAGLLAARPISSNGAGRHAPDAESHRATTS